jgi:hypothetical protein
LSVEIRRDIRPARPALGRTYRRGSARR